jgi:anti-sigma factor RsiW
MHDLLHAYVDGELDLAHTLEVERHLEGCPACARACAGLRELRTGLRARLPRFAPPAGLEARIRTAARQRERLRRFARAPWRLAALASAAAVLAAALAVALAFLRSAPARDRLVQEVIDSHVRSQLAGRHLLDVEAADGHVVKPWFQGKLDFAPPVLELGEEGFPLEGGRLDYVNGRPVAALVYRRRGHVINLLIWPGAPGEKDTPPRSEARQGYHLSSWRRQGMTWWAVSDLNPEELAGFARLLRRE